MSYITLFDYKRRIQTTELNAITSNDANVRLLSEQSVFEEINEVLMQRFDTALEFTDTAIFSPTIIYKGGRRIYLDAQVYNPLVQYLAVSKAMVLQAGFVYIILSDTPSPAGAFDASKWTKLGAQNDIFFVTLPAPPFNVDALYLKQDTVFWKDKVYTAQMATIFADQQDLLQVSDLEKVVFGNIAPDDRINGARFWGTGTPYALSVGILPTDTTKWTKGDNRNQGVIKIFLDMVIYDMCARIAPNNVPEHRHNNWVLARKRLDDYANGKRNAQIAIIQPKTGNRVQFGGEPKEKFNW